MTGTGSDNLRTIVGLATVLLEMCLLSGYITSCVALWEIEDKTEFAFTSCIGGNKKRSSEDQELFNLAAIYHN